MEPCSGPRTDARANEETDVRDRPTLLRLWQPPAETLETIAGALRAHWLATRIRPERPFWPEAAGWLRGEDAQLTPGNVTAGVTAR